MHSSIPRYRRASTLMARRRWLLAWRRSQRRGDPSRRGPIRHAGHVKPRQLV